MRALGRTVMGCLLLSAACGRSEPKSETEAKGASSGTEARVACGKVECAAGEICCNPSCGICTAPDGMCTQQFCDEGSSDVRAGEPLPPPAITCDNVRCAAGTHCELVEVQCVRAPCDPVPQCRPDGDSAPATKQ